MKNLRYVLKKYKTWFAMIIIAIFVIVIFAIIFEKSKTIEDYFLSNYESATEILYHDSFLEDYEVIFFLEDGDYISCALLKNEWFGYQIVRTSGKLSLYNSGYLCSFFHDDGRNLWIDWGIITDGNIKSVWTGAEEMKIVECKPYNYRICWLTGSGKEPQNHVEKK